MSCAARGGRVAVEEDGFIAQWQYAYPIYGAAVILLLAAAYRSFKKHQVGK